MSDQCSELVQISKLNGDFRRNYDKVSGAILNLHFVSAAQRRSWLSTGLASFACSGVLASQAQRGWSI